MWLEVLFSAPQSGSTNLSGGNNVYINWVNNLGHSFLKSCELEIGGQQIDKLYSQWLDIWNELTDDDKKFHLGLGKNSSKDTYLESNNVREGAPHAGDIDILLQELERRTYIHLPFWFSKNVGSALPLIALQYHEVKLKLKTRSLSSLINTNGEFSGNITYSSPNVQLWIDYIYLDTDERRRFAQVSHEYLIEQLQVVSKSVSSDDAKFKMNIDLNHPVKELIWVNQKDVNISEISTLPTSSSTIDAANNEDSNNDYFNYSSNLSNSTSKSYIERINGQKSIEGFDKMTLKLNGHERFEKRNASYFRLCQPYQCGHKIPEKHIYCYSFALKPQEHQPSGSCNFSRIDDASLQFDGIAKHTNGNTVTCYAINYNVLRIMSGMGGLAYSN